MIVTPNETARFLSFRAEAREREAAARAARLRRLLPGAARLLRETYGVKEVWIFGSLAGGGFHRAATWTWR